MEKQNSYARRGTSVISQRLALQTLLSQLWRALRDRPPAAPRGQTSQSRTASAVFTSFLFILVTRKEKGKLNDSQTARRAGTQHGPCAVLLYNEWYLRTTAPCAVKAACGTGLPAATEPCWQTCWGSKPHDPGAAFIPARNVCQGTANDSQI